MLKPIRVVCKGKKPLMLLLAGLLVLVLAAAGCSGKDDGKKPVEQNKPPISSTPNEEPVKVTLYFSDSQAEMLLPEEREVDKKEGTIEEVVVNELIKGPKKEGLTKTIPESAKLLSIKVVDGVAYVNFSKEIQTKHWGGSAGESMTIYSVTNSLAKLDGIKKVQFLVEGNKVESLLGHMDTTEPVEPNLELVKQ